MGPPAVIHPTTRADEIPQTMKTLIGEIARRGCATTPDGRAASTQDPMMIMPAVNSAVPPTTMVSTVEAASPCAGSVVQIEIADPLHHRSNVTPPASVPKGSLQTPDEMQLFLHVSIEKPQSLTVILNHCVLMPW